MSERGHLQVDIEGNSSGFRSVMNAVKTQASQFSKEVNSGFSRSWGGIGKGIVGGIVGALSFEAVKSSFQGFLSKAQGLQDLSEQMNMGTDQTQKWSKAVQELGLSFGGLQSVLATIEQTRSDALTDPKAAAKFKALGISRADVIDTKGVDASTFAQMVLAAGGKDEASRAALGDLAGKRAMKYIGAGAEYSRARPDIDAEGIAIAKDAERVGRLVENKKDRTASNILLALKEWADLFKEVRITKGSTTKDTYSAALPLTRGPRKKGGSSATVDPMDSILAEAAAKRDERRANADERIADAERQNMTTSAKRASLEKELATVRQRQQDLDKREPSAKLKDPEEIGEFWTKKYEDMAALKAKEQGIMGELRSKPTRLGATGLAASGLFSASAMNFGMSGDTLREQLNVQRQMLRALLSHRDPHSF